MVRRGDIRTFEDEAFLSCMARRSWAVLGAGALAAAATIALLATFAPGALDAPLGPLAGLGGPGGGATAVWLAVFGAACVVSLGVHELVHAAVFKACAPAGTAVSFGANLSQGMVFASADGAVFTRRQYLVALLAPSILVTAALAAAAAGAGFPVTGIALAAVHLSGCTGDWGYVEAILADPEITHCQDTSWGVRFLADGPVTDASSSEAPPSGGASSNGEGRP